MTSTRSGEFPQDIRQLFADHDLFGLPFEEQHGGTGTGELMLCAAIEEIAKGCASSSLMVACQDLASLPMKTPRFRRTQGPDPAADGFR